MALLVGEVMTREVTTVPPGMTLKEMDRVLLERGVSGAPVVERGRLLGIVSRADVLRTLYDDQVAAQRVSDCYGSPFPISIASLEHLSRDSRKIAEHLIKLSVREIMTRDPRTVSPSDTLESAAKLMVSDGIHRLPVTQDERLVGIISSLDIARMVSEIGFAKD